MPITMAMAMETAQAMAMETAPVMALVTVTATETDIVQSPSTATETALEKAPDK